MGRDVANPLTVTSEMVTRPRILSVVLVLHSTSHICPDLNPHSSWAYSKERLNINFSTNICFAVFVPRSSIPSLQSRIPLLKTILSVFALTHTHTYSIVHASKPQKNFLINKLSKTTDVSNLIYHYTSHKTRRLKESMIRDRD